MNDEENIELCDLEDWKDFLEKLEDEDIIPIENTILFNEQNFQKESKSQDEIIENTNNQNENIYKEDELKSQKEKIIEVESTNKRKNDNEQLASENKKTKLSEEKVLFDHQKFIMNELYNTEREFNFVNSNPSLTRINKFITCDDEDKITSFFCREPSGNGNTVTFCHFIKKTIHLINKTIVLCPIKNSINWHRELSAVGLKVECIVSHTRNREIYREEIPILLSKPFDVLIMVDSALTFIDNITIGRLIIDKPRQTKLFMALTKIKSYFTWFIEDNVHSVSYHFKKKLKVEKYFKKPFVIDTSNYSIDRFQNIKIIQHDYNVWKKIILNLITSKSTKKILIFPSDKNYKPIWQSLYNFRKRENFSFDYMHNLNVYRLQKKIDDFNKSTNKTTILLCTCLNFLNGHNLKVTDVVILDSGSFIPDGLTEKECRKRIKHNFKNCMLKVDCLDDVVEFHHCIFKE